MIVDDERVLLEDLGRFACPTCNQGRLRVLKDSIQQMPPAWIRQLPEEDEYYTDDDGKECINPSYWLVEGTELDETRAVFLLECSNESCLEIVSTCGVFKPSQTFQESNDGSPPTFFLEEYYFPKFFHPTLRLFAEPEDAPGPIKEELTKAFSLYWSSPPACGNSIRKLVERILDDISPLSQPKSLHERIKSLEPKFDSLKKFLMATKWIGNDGSHYSDLTHSDVNLALKFIERSLKELYSDESALESLAEKILKERRPPSKSKGI